MQRYPSPYHLSMETHLLIPATLYAPWVAPPTWRLPSHYHRHALHGLQYHIPPTFVPRYKQQLYQIKWFCTHTHNTHTHTHTRMHTHKRDILKQVPSFLHKDHWMHQATCPHSTNQLLRYSAKEHPATLYGISASSFKYWSSCNILPFCNYTSSPALLQYPQYSLIIFSTA